MDVRGARRARAARHGRLSRFLHRLWHGLRCSLVALSGIGPFAPPPPPPPPPPLEERNDDGAPDEAR